MKDFGSSAFDAGFGRPAGAPVPPPLPPSRREGGDGTSRAFLFVLLVIACMLLGGLLNWGMRQRAERARLFERNIEVEQSYVTVLAKRNDLASFLTDPRTRLHRLAGLARAGGRSATVAWQQATGTGVLIGDDVPLPADGHAYALWYLGGGGGGDAGPVLCGMFRPEAGVTFYDFRVADAAAAVAGEPRGFRVTDEADARPAAPGRGVVYETR